MQQLVLALTIALISAAGWLWWIRRYDRIEPEPLWLILRVGAVGGLTSALVAGWLNDLILAVLKVGPAPGALPLVSSLGLALWVGFNEELCKLLATLWLVREQPELDEPIDAMIYAMSVALGFATLENVLYALHWGASVVLLRALLSVPAHLAFAALWGYGLAQVRFNRQDKRRLTLAFTLVLAALAHAAYDFFVFPKTWTVLLVAPLVVGLAWLARRRLQYLVGQTLHLQSGECPDCYALNRPIALECHLCGGSLVQEIYCICPGCECKFLPTGDACPKCGLLP